MQHSGFIHLQQLINGLTVTEREAIRQRSLIKHNRNGRAAVVKLYELMLKYPNAEEELIYNRWQRTHMNAVSRHAFENTRTQLKIFILESCRLLNVPGDDSNLQQKLDFAEILKSKGLMDEAYKMLSSVDKKEVNNSQNFYHVIMNYKKLLLLPYIPGKDTLENMRQLLSETQEAITQAQIFHLIFSFNLEVGSIARKTTIVKTEKQRESLLNLLNHPATQLDTATLNKNGRSVLYKTFNWLHHILNNTREAYEYQQLLVKLMEEDEETNMKFHLQQYCAEIASMINVSIILKEFDNAALYLEKYESVCRRKELTQPINQLVINNYQICLLLAKDQLTADNEILHRQLLLLNSIPWKIQKGHFATFIFIVMKAFFITGQYKTVVSCYSGLLMEQVNEREDVAFCAEIIYTLALYHMQMPDMRYQMIEITKVFREQAESLQRRLRIDKTEQPFEIHLSNCFRNLSVKMRFRDHITILNKLLHNLDETDAAGFIYVQQFYRLFDIRKWAMHQIRYLESLVNKKGDAVEHRLSND